MTQTYLAIPVIVAQPGVPVKPRASRPWARRTRYDNRQLTLRLIFAS